MYKISKLKSIWMLVILFICFCMILKLDVKAASGYEIKMDDSGQLTCYYDGEQMYNSRVAVKVSGNSYKVVKPGTSGSAIYYFGGNGIGKKLTSTRFMQISYAGKKQVYYAKKGVIQKNKIVGSTQEGYYYVDKNGVRIKDKTYVITKNEKGKLVCYYKGKLQKNIRIAVKVSGNSYKSVKPGTKGSRIYLFNKNGIGKKDTGTRFATIAYQGKKNKYYIQKGIIQKNKIVGSKKAGYQYVDENGVCVTDKTTKAAVDFVIKHTSTSDSAETKLKKCYIYLSSYFEYKRVYDVSKLYPKAGDIDDIAYETFSTKQGNCHSFASAFAYIAKVLGYTSRVDVGMCHGSGPGASNGWSPHGWAEVYIDGKWYFFDPDLDLYTSSHTQYYKKGEFYYQVKWKLQSYTKNGSIKWKTDK